MLGDGDGTWCDLCRACDADAYTDACDRPVKLHQAPGSRMLRQTSPNSNKGRAARVMIWSVHTKIDGESVTSLFPL